MPDGRGAWGRVEHVMGTVFSFEVRTPRTTHLEAAVDDAVALLHDIDRVFSTYRDDSAISRLGRGEIRVEDCPPEVADVLALCDEAAALTDGWFTATPGGRLDPSGMVKGWAVQRASDLLLTAGAADHAVNGGGDVQSRGGLRTVGIAHPLHPGALIAAVRGTDLAVATSGGAERGAHILDPHTGRPVEHLASITLIGRRIVDVDALATAAYAMGAGARTWLGTVSGVEALAVLPDGRAWWTPGFPALTAPGTWSLE